MVEWFPKIGVPLTGEDLSNLADALHLEAVASPARPVPVAPREPGLAPEGPGGGAAEGARANGTAGASDPAGVPDPAGVLTGFLGLVGGLVQRVESLEQRTAALERRLADLSAARPNGTG